MLQEYKELNKIRRRSAILVALILHMIIGIIYVFRPDQEISEDGDKIIGGMGERATKTRSENSQNQAAVEDGGS